MNGGGSSDVTFADVCAVLSASRFPHSSETAVPERSVVLELRSTIQKALTTNEFLIECIDRELALVEPLELRRGLMPFFVDPFSGARFSLGYWPPGGSPGPHEHTAWTITAVCSNRLDVHTFDRDETYRRKVLVPKNLFKADARQVGYIYEPSIHCPINTSGSWSLSLHISSPWDGIRAEDTETLPSLAVPNQTIISGLKAQLLRNRQRQSEIDVLARVLLATPASAGEPLRKCFRLANSATRRSIAKQIPELSVRSQTWLLRRRWSELDLQMLHVPAGWALAHRFEKNSRPQKVLVSGELIESAFQVVTQERTFDVLRLPGNLTEEERIALGDALEATGLFERADT